MSLHAFEFDCDSDDARAAAIEKAKTFPFVVDVRRYTRTLPSGEVFHAFAYVIDPALTDHGDPHVAGSVVAHALRLMFDGKEG